MNFKKKSSLVLEIKDNLIDLIVGNITEIAFEGTLQLEEGICEDGYIKDVSKLTNILNLYFSKNNITEKNISFVVFGSDVMTRTIEVPYMRKSNLEKAIEFEITEVITNSEQYYVDYEIIKEIKDNGGKTIRYEVLLAACAKKKIDLLVQLSESLDKNIQVIDLLTNILNKVLINSKINYFGKNIGVFYFGSNFSNISISKDGILKLERTIPFGEENIIKGVKQILEEERGEAVSVEEAVNLTRRKTKDIDAFFEEYPRVKNITNQLLELVYKTIQFYSAGKGETAIDKIAIVSKVKLNESIVEYGQRFFNTEIVLIEEAKDIGMKVKNKNKDMFRYLSLYGLFLRR